MSIVSNPSASEQQLTSKVDHFLAQHRVSKMLKQSNFFKECGFTCFELFKSIFLLAFSNKSVSNAEKRRGRHPTRQR
jgi:hypothetical protein